MSVGVPSPHSCYDVTASPNWQFQRKHGHFSPAGLENHEGPSSLDLDMIVGEVFPPQYLRPLWSGKKPQFYRTPEVFCSSAAWRRELRRWK